jgi:surfeit locus 1 family protein
MMVFPAIAFGLGTWQIYRWDRKQTMLAHREERRMAPTEHLPLTMDAEDVKQKEFRHFVVGGVYDHAREMIVSPRSFEGESGFYVVTPLGSIKHAPLVCVSCLRFIVS